MYSKLTNSERALFSSQNYKVVSIRVSPIEGDEFTLTEKEIVQNSLSIDRYCQSGSHLEIGSAIAAELKFQIDNRSGTYNDTRFEGAELFIKVGTKDWTDTSAAITWVPCGYFTVDSPPRKFSTISISALDRMVQFDKAVDFSTFVFPCSVTEFFMKCCTQCGVSIVTDTIDNFVNADYQIVAAPSESNLTYRMLIQWIGQITGTCAYFDWDGKLRMEWYKDTGIVITPALRYQGADLYEEDVTVSGVIVEDIDGKQYLSGSDEYAITISGNSLIQANYDTVASTLAANLIGFTYRPYSCTTKSLPYIYPLDGVTYTDKDGNDHSTIITHCTFKLNGRMTLQAKGETMVQGGWAAMNPLTAREAAILEHIRKNTETRLTAYEQAMIDLNKTVENSSGLYTTAKKESNGSTVYYFHNKKKLADSDTVWMFSNNAFVWTDDYNGSTTIWENGVDASGNAILTSIAAATISGEYIDGDYIIGGTISGDKIVANSITAAKIQTEGLMCTALYASNRPDGCTARLNGTFGDFGMFVSGANMTDTALHSSCIWGVYRSDNANNVINFCSFGNIYAGYNANDGQHIFYAKNKWKFEDATIVGKLDLSNTYQVILPAVVNAIAVFGE